MRQAAEPLSYRATGRFSPLFCDYAENKSELREFHSGFPDQAAFSGIMAAREKTFHSAQRKLLCHALTDKDHHPAQKANLEKLGRENCFTVSCGHQLCIAGGPQYMAFKILGTIKLAAELKIRFPEKDFVPVFWMAGEDHDLEEILSFHFFQQAYRIQLEGSGAVGRLDCADVQSQLSSIRDFPAPMAEAYKPGSSLAEATRKWLNRYFGDKGLLILDPDRHELKASFLPFMLKELESDALFRRVASQTERLEKMGYEPQLHLRELNLFFLEEGRRERLIHNGNAITTSSGTRSWTQEEALDFFTQHPECLSPNAAMRPLYSQFLLPDLAFIGGPAEIAYWLQIKPAFDLHELIFPLLIPRFSALILPESRSARMEKLEISMADLFQEEVMLRRKLALGEENLPVPELRTAFSEMLKLAAEQDASLVPALEAEIHRMEVMAEGMMKRIRKAAEKKAETQLKQLQNILEFCFPGGGLLERSESWLSMLVQNPAALDELYELISPLDFRFQLLIAEGNAGN